MRYSASDKTEIIRLVEQSTLPARRTLEKLGIPRSSLYRWYDRYQRGGPRKPSRIAPHGRIGSGTASQRLSAARLSTWRWIRQPELRATQELVVLTDEARILCLRKRRSIGF